MFKKIFLITIISAASSAPVHCIESKKNQQSENKNEDQYKGKKVKDLYRAISKNIQKDVDGILKNNKFSKTDLESAFDLAFSNDNFIFLSMVREHIKKFYLGNLMLDYDQRTHDRALKEGKKSIEEGISKGNNFEIMVQDEKFLWISDVLEGNFSLIKKIISKVDASYFKTEPFTDHLYLMPHAVACDLKNARIDVINFLIKTAKEAIKDLSSEKQIEKRYEITSWIHESIKKCQSGNPKLQELFLIPKSFKIMEELLWSNINIFDGINLDSVDINFIKDKFDSLIEYKNDAIQEREHDIEISIQLNSIFQDIFRTLSQSKNENCTPILKHIIQRFVENDIDLPIDALVLSHKNNSDIMNYIYSMDNDLYNKVLHKAKLEPQDAAQPVLKYLSDPQDSDQCHHNQDTEIVSKHQIITPGEEERKE